MQLDLPLLRLSLVAACSSASCSCRAVQERLQLAGAEGGVEQGEQGAGSQPWHALLRSRSARAQPHSVACASPSLPATSVLFTQKLLRALRRSFSLQKLSEGNKSH